MEVSESGNWVGVPKFLTFVKYFFKFFIIYFFSNISFFIIITQTIPACQVFDKLFSSFPTH